MRLAIALWAAALVAVCVGPVVAPRKRTLYPTYAAAGADWLAGRDVYARYPDPQAPHLDSFRYAPPVAAALAPWSLLPEAAGEVLWRLVGAGLYLGAAAWWARCGLPEKMAGRRAAWLAVLLLPLALSSLQNGQTNLHVAAALLATVTAAAQGRWRPAAACMAAATALKLYPLAVGLLIAAAYPRRLLPPLLVALAVAAAVPFAAQRPGYVVGQYRSWLDTLALNEGRADWPAHMAYRDLWLLWRNLGLPLGRGAYQAVQLGLAAACAAAVAAARRRGQTTPAVLTAALALGTGWMALCGPATESSTFVVLAPPLAWLALAPGQGWPRRLAWAAWAVFAVAVLAGLTGQTNRVHGLGPHPVAALLFLAAAFGVAARRPPGPSEARPAARAA
jgi:hypothetical protein